MNKFTGLCAMLAMTALPMLAHHSFAAEFDSNKPMKVEGTLTKLEWTNPHIWFYFDAKDDSGNVVKWQCEGGAPNNLVRNGWDRDSIKPGTVITVEGWMAKDGSKTCNARSIKLPGGKSVFAGSSNDSAKQ